MLVVEPPKKPSLHGLWYTVPEVAAKLEWSEDTIHHHTVPLGEWERDLGQIPYKLRGETKLIPRWWLAKWIDDAVDPPPGFGVPAEVE